MTGSAKQSMPPRGEEWIASSLTLLAMTAGMKGAFRAFGWNQFPTKRVVAPEFENFRAIDEGNVPVSENRGVFHVAAIHRSRRAAQRRHRTRRAAAPDRSDDAAAVHRGLRGEKPDAGGVARRHRGIRRQQADGGFRTRICVEDAGRFGAEIVNAGTFLPCNAASDREQHTALQQVCKTAPAKGAMAFRPASLYWCG